MIVVCAWCERFLGASGAELVVSHGICEPCAASERQPASPVIVISRHRAEMRGAIECLLRADPAIRVVIDRRFGDRRRGAGEAESAGERRRGSDRRLRPADAILL